MKNKFINILLAIIVASTIINIYFTVYKDKQGKQAEKRYTEIKESIKKASEQFLRATHPNCSISNEYIETYTTSGFENTSWLINNGLIKKNELLDIDKKSYCDALIKYKTYFENPLDHQKNCKVYYEIYLKCKNYEDNGYIDTGL